MHYELCIRSEELLADLRSAAWLEQELHSELDGHRRHQMADICETDNVERVWRVLGLAVAEIRLALRKMLRPDKAMQSDNELVRHKEWSFNFKFEMHADVVGYLREKIHEYLVASVMADRAAVIIPECAPIWEERRTAALAALSLQAATARPLCYGPVRRPLWPLRH